MKPILLLGRKGIVVADARSHLDDPDLVIYTGTNIDDVRGAMEDANAKHGGMSHVLMGAGIDLDERLAIVKEIFLLSERTCVHLKDAKSGPQGFLPFVKAILQGLSMS